MTLDSSLSSSTASVNNTSTDKRLPKGIRIIRTDAQSARSIEIVSSRQDQETPWGYLFIHHYLAEKFETMLKTSTFEGDFTPKCFIHRSIIYKRNASGKGIIKQERPSVSGLVFLQGETPDLALFLKKNFPQYHLVKNCATGQPASIKHSIMKPFMALLESDPNRVTFLRDSFLEFAKNHVKLRVLTGVLKGMEGYIVRISGDRQLVMDIGGKAVAISHVHNEDFEVAE